MKNTLALIFLLSLASTAHAATDPVFQVNDASGAVNGVQITGAATGSAPTLSSFGTDTNVGLIFNTQGTGALTLQTAGSGNIVLTPGTGIVSIGTSSGASELNVNGGVSIGTSYTGTASPTNGLIVQGNVGIGTSSPSDVLDINGALGLTTTTASLPVNGIYSPASNNLTLTTSGVSALTITSTQSVGIGTATPSSTLQIAGNTNTTTLQLNSLEVPMPPGGRLTCSSTLPVMNSDCAAATTLYYLPYNSQIVPLYNGTHWQEYDLGSSGLSLAFDRNSAHTGYQQTGKVFDVVLWLNSGTLTLCTGPAWTSNTARASGIKRLNGLQVNSGTWALKCDTTSSTFSANDSQAIVIGTIATTNANVSSLTASNQTSTATTLSVTTTPVTGPGLGEQYYVLVDTTTPEVELVTGGFGTTTLTVTRGQRGTSAVAHTSPTVAIDSGQAAQQFKPGAISKGTGPLLGVYNFYNQVPIFSLESDTTVGVGSTSSWAAFNSSTMNRITVLDGLGASNIFSNLHLTIGDSTAGDFCTSGIMQNSTTVGPNFFTVSNGATNTANDNIQHGAAGEPFLSLLGVNYYQIGVIASGTNCSFGTAAGEDYMVLQLND